jgi:hypothetical protein
MGQFSVEKPVAPGQFPVEINSLTAAPAPAQTAAPGTVPPPADAQAASAKPKANTAAPPATVRVTNSRKANLVWLAAAEPGSSNWTTVLGVVKAGKKASTKLS